jgi:pantetheine-phosphate adenylyltransferase
MVAIVTGSFDPITIGHLEIIKKAAQEYEILYVVALVNPEKEGMFNLNQRKELIELSVRDIPNVVADAYLGLTAEYMNQRGITKIVRGIRSEKDEKYEIELANAMKEFNPNFDTSFIYCDEQFSEITSTVVRDRIKKGQDLFGFVPEQIIESLMKMLEKN